MPCFHVFSTRINTRNYSGASLTEVTRWIVNKTCIWTLNPLWLVPQSSSNVNSLKWASFTAPLDSLIRYLVHFGPSRYTGASGIWYRLSQAGIPARQVQRVKVTRTLSITIIYLLGVICIQCFWIRFGFINIAFRSSVSNADIHFQPIMQGAEIAIFWITFWQNSTT